MMPSKEVKSKENMITGLISDIFPGKTVYNKIN